MLCQMFRFSTSGNTVVSASFVSLEAIVLNDNTDIARSFLSSLYKQQISFTSQHLPHLSLDP